MIDLDEMTLEQYEHYWYERSAALFGEAHAKKMQAEKRNHYLIMKQLWMEKGFRNHGEYAAWEKEHYEEAKDYFKQKGEKYER